MKGKKGARHIRAHVLTALLLVVLCCFAAVMGIFNVFVWSLIEREATAQLSETARAVGALEQADPFRERGETPLPPQGQRGLRWARDLDRTQNRIGTTGSFFLMDAEGSVLDNVTTEEDNAALLAGLIGNGQVEQGKQTRLESGGRCFYVLVNEDRMLDCLSVCYVEVTGIRTFASTVNLVLGISMAVIGAAAALAALRLAGQWSRPVVELSDFATAIGEGRFEGRDQVYRVAEFNQLQDRMNQAAQRLKESDEKQKAFFQNVSHELRTPLMNIRCYAEGLTSGVMDRETAGNVLIRETDRLTGMVEDLLYISRLDRRKERGRKEELDLREVLSACASDQRAQAEKKGVTFVYDFEDREALYPCAEEDMRQLFGNLISNAVRYAEKTVTLTCRDLGGEVRVTVSDDGPGVAPEDLPHVFERFYKGRGGNHGIGLSIVRGAAESYGGSVEVSRGETTDFTVRLPRE